MTRDLSRKNESREKATLFNMKKNAIRLYTAKAAILIAAILLAMPAIIHTVNAIYAVCSPSPAERADYSDEIAAAQEYNDYLAGTAYHELSSDENERYMRLLNVGGSGVMGRISIPKINVELPIYHGVTEDVLQMAIGHMPGTSLPVVSESSHVVISGHRGLATKAMFTDLPELEIGDTFQITALNQVLTYEVDRILTVFPEELDKVEIEPGKEYCTLVTCTPLGVNSHRLLVRGHRTGEVRDADAPKTAADVLLELVQGKVLAVYETIMLGAGVILILAEFALPPAVKRVKSARNKKEN